MVKVSRGFVSGTPISRILVLAVAVLATGPGCGDGARSTEPLKTAKAIPKPVAAVKQKLEKWLLGDAMLSDAEYRLLATVENKGKLREKDVDHWREVIGFYRKKAKASALKELEVLGWQMINSTEGKLTRPDDAASWRSATNVAGQSGALPLFIVFRGHPRRDRDEVWGHLCVVALVELRTKHSQVHVLTFFTTPKP